MNGLQLLGYGLTTFLYFGLRWTQAEVRLNLDPLGWLFSWGRPSGEFPSQDLHFYDLFGSIAVSCLTLENASGAVLSTEQNFCPFSLRFA